MNASRVIFRGVSSAVLILTCACASAPPAPPPPVPAPPPAPMIPAERKLSWIARLEQQRVLTDASVGADLVALAGDADTGIRKRAIVALGRVGMAEGAPVLATLLV